MKILEPFSERDHYEDVISNLRRDMADMRKSMNAELASMRVRAAYYERMVRHIRENENLKYAWQEFLTLYALSYPLEELGGLNNLQALEELDKE